MFIRLTLLALALLVPGVAHAQGHAAWDAASGLPPDEIVPEWSAAAAPSACGGPREALAGGLLVIDTSACGDARGTYSLIHSGAILPPAATSAFVEAELRVVSSLGLDPDTGAVQLVAIPIPFCPWLLHVDAGEVFLEAFGGGGRTASALVDTTTALRTYRLEVDAVTWTARAFVDGQLVLASGFAAPFCLQPGQQSGGAGFGDYFERDGGVVEWRRVTTDLGPLEQGFCQGAVTPNSRGQSGFLNSNGARSVAANALVLRAAGLPPGAPGYLLCSRGFAPPTHPAGSQGSLCLAAPIGRFNAPGQVVQAPASGVVLLPVDLTALPQPGGPVAAAPGETWAFQLWYRDVNPGPTSNLTGGYWLTLE